MSASPEQNISELIAHLGASDANARALALAALVRHGRAASPVLQSALQGTDSALRALAARALAEIADPATADTLAQGLHDADPHVRGRCAQGLANMRDARALDALILTINDIPDLLHYPQSVATVALRTYGQEAVTRVTPLLNADDAATRQRAHLVLQQCLHGQNPA